MRTIPTGSPLTCAVTCQRHSRSRPGLQPAPPRTPRARNSAAMIETRRNAASPPMTSPVAAARVIGSWTMRPRAPGVKLNSGAHRARNEWPLACAAHNPRKPLLPREWPVRVHPSRLRYRWSCSPQCRHHRGGWCHSAGPGSRRSTARTQAGVHVQRHCSKGVPEHLLHRLRPGDRSRQVTQP
jgi:hypothetical protein